MNSLRQMAAALLAFGSLVMACHITAATDSQSNTSAAAINKPVKVFILLGQSNMWGVGHVGPMSFKGSLMRAVQKDHLYPFLADKSGNWSVSHRIRYVHVMPGRSDYSKKQWDAYWNSHSLTEKMPNNMMDLLYNQWMSVTGHRFIGPEFGIAHEVGKDVHGPLLILKSCIGNRSIGWDLLPPGSKSEFYTDKQGRVWQYAAYGQTPNKWIKGTPRDQRHPVRWYAGKEYDMDTTFARYVLANLPNFYPGAKRYKVMGFFFWQGEKDLGDIGLATHYEKNLAAFIHAVRKAFNAPKAPFVLGTLGEAVKGHAKGTEALVLKAQLAVANPAIHPEFKGNVATVYTHPLSLGGSGNGHYNGNCQTYMNVGLAMGKAMNKLLQNH
ncbi:MAG: sialate O-acetylesterase [Phycisphaerae bacterium]